MLEFENDYYLAFRDLPIIFEKYVPEGMHLILGVGLVGLHGFYDHADSLP